MERLISSDSESSHVLSDEDELVDGNLVQAGPDGGSSDFATNWREAYLALKSAFTEVKGRYRKTQQQAADLQKRLKQLEKKDSKGMDQKEKENLKTNIFALQQQISKLKKKNSLLQAQLKSGHKYISRSGVQRLPERGDYCLELVAANKTIEELQEQLLRQKNSEDDQAESEAKQEELARKLEKGFAAYNEKYHECEELKKRIEELEELLNNAESEKAQFTPDDPDSGCIEPVVGVQIQHVVVTEEMLGIVAKKVETDKREKKDEELGEKRHFKEAEQLWDYLHQILGLEVMKDGENYDILLTDRDKLQQWLTSSTFGSVRVCFDAVDSRDSSTETGDVEKKDTSVQVSLEFEQENKNNIGAREILLKQKIQDQASHIERLNRMMGILKEQREIQQRQKDQVEQKSQEQVAVEDKGVSTDEDPLLSALTQNLSNEDSKHVFTRLAEALRDAKRLQEELEQQQNCLKELADVTSRYREFKEESRATSENKPPPDKQQTGLKRQTLKEGLGKDSETTAGGARPKEKFNIRNITGHAPPLTVPVQETDKSRRPLAGASPQLQTENEDKQTPERHSLNEASLTAESGLYTESDIEVLGEDDTDNPGGAVSLEGRICPVCSKLFHVAVSQVAFEQHVQLHFDSDVDE